MPKNQKKLLIFDGNAIIHRSFHALPPTMALKDGTMVNAVYGFATVLIKALKEFKPDYAALTLDKKGPTFRHKKYKEYKAKRIKAPDELYNQFPFVKRIAEGFNIPVFEMQGFEADDLIGTIAQKAGDEIDKIIVTGDMDTLQLINKSTKVYAMSRGLADSVLYDSKAVQERFGLSPEQMIDYKALRGDPSDNIPGVKGIGEKTAVELLKEFKTLDSVYKNIKSKKIKDRIRDLLLMHKKEAYLSQELSRIEKNAPIQFELNNLKFGNFNKSQAVETLSRMEFKSLLPRVHSLLSGNIKFKDQEQADKFSRNKKIFKYNLIDNNSDFENFLAKLKKQKQFVFDTETSSVDPLDAELLGISFCWRPGEAYFVNFKNQKSDIKNQERNLFNLEKSNKKEDKKIHPWLEKLKPIFEDDKIKKIGHNIKFDVRVLQSQGVGTAGISFDTMIASYLLNPGSRQHSLDALSFTELGFEKISKDDLLGKGREKISFSEVDTEKLAVYSCEDADCTYKLAVKLRPHLKDQKMEELFNEIEMPLVKILADMENSGILLDKNHLEQMNKRIEKKLQTLRCDIYQEAGCEFNINSTQQLKKILFEELRIPTDNISKIKTGFSTGAEELEKLKNLHPIIPLIQDYRELAKLSTTYVNALPELVNPRTKRLHTSFNQAITATGRLSSTEPNLQNIPIRTEMGREIRGAFIADKSFKLVSLDYSQIELRLAAHLSGDKKMIKAFAEGLDIHASTAAEINGVALNNITSQMRREAKAINFGILYGQGPHGLAQSADIPFAAAKAFIDQYFASYPQIKKYIEKSISQAREKGYAETLFGRKRYLPEINSAVMMVRKAAERMAINMPIQGTAADMIKLAMIEIGKQIVSGDARMLLQVHDELVFEIRESKIREISEKIKTIMENIMALKVPIIVDAKVGDNWDRMEKIK